MKNTAVVLAGGRGSRMKSETRKQYLQIAGKPVLCYSLDVFQACGEIQEIVLVCGAGEEAWCREHIVEAFGYTKVTAVVPGGRERYHSVYEGLKAADPCDYVLIHDGARPFIDAGILERVLRELPRCRACVVGMPVKDTIKLADAGGFVEQTLPRDRLWMIQTPQSFAFPLIYHAYRELLSGELPDVPVTDDAMVAEYISRVPVKLIEGSYENIKITTPEDLLLAESIIKKR